MKKQGAELAAADALKAKGDEAMGLANQTSQLLKPFPFQSNVHSGLPDTQAAHPGARDLHKPTLDLTSPRSA